MRTEICLMNSQSEICTYRVTHACDRQPFLRHWRLIGMMYPLVPPIHSPLDPVKHPSCLPNAPLIPFVGLCEHSAAYPIVVAKTSFQNPITAIGFLRIASQARHKFSTTGILKTYVQ